MTDSKIIKAALFGWIYLTNLLFAFLLWLCGLSGNIMIGIILIAFYRLSLWFTPLAVTVVCWIPLRPKVSIRKRILSNLFHLAFCGLLFLLCFLLFGNWY